MSDVTFVAPYADPAAPGSIYGAGHQATIADEAVVRQLQRDGKVSLKGPDARQIRPTAIAATTATISYTIDQPCLSNFVQPVGSPTFTQQAGTPATGGAVSCNLTGLITATTYTYKVTVCYGPGTTIPVTTPGVYTFTTL